MNHTQADTVDRLLSEAINQCWLAADPERPTDARAEAIRDALTLLRQATSEVEIGAAKLAAAD